MSPVTGLGLRRLRDSDAPAVLAAFTSNPDMTRQGDLATLSDAECYVHRLIAPDSPHDAWVIADDDLLAGLVCVTVDEENKSGWF